MAKDAVLVSEQLNVLFDGEKGIIKSLSAQGCQFAANEQNTSYPQILGNPQWLGDIFVRTWQTDGSWLEQKTALSDDIRTVTHKDNTVTVCYKGSSSLDGGFKNLDITQTFVLKDNRLEWHISLINTANHTLEIGEISLPFMTNNDFTGLFMKDYPQVRPSDNKQAQKLWHTDRVMQHIHTALHSSYVFLQRPSGDFPALMFNAVGDDSWLETAYQIDSTIGDQFSCTFEGPYYLSICSSAARKTGRWLGTRDYQRYGLCGHSSVLLGIGESRTLSFAFTVAESYEDIGNILYNDGQVVVTVAPSMTAPVDSKIQFALHCKTRPQLWTEANGVQLEEGKVEGDMYFYTLHLSTTGQKRIRVLYGGRQTLLFFFAIPRIAQAVNDHAQFLVKNQYYQNKNDPYGRYHSFLCYDSMYETFFLEGDESWQVAASDEFCLPPAMFLAEKNVVNPNAEEVEIMEEYIDDFLFNVLQNPQTYEVKRGCYWEEERPSGMWNWTKEKASQTSRSFNYILVADIYHSMYKIGALYGLTKRRTPQQYLEMAAKSSIMGFTRGFHTHMAGPGGFGSIWLLRDLKKENSPYYQQLYDICAAFAAQNNADEYPYGSELYTDQTAHHQIYAYMKEFGYTEKEKQTIKVSKALRGGWQPSWYGYGKEQRGSVCCWYGTAHNSYTLTRGFETEKDMQLLSLGFGGMLGFLSCIRQDGRSTGWYTWWPDRQGFDPRSMDTDLGMYALMKIFKSYVTVHPLFGLYGWCCDVEQKGSIIDIVPKDGLQKRLYIDMYDIDIELEKGEIKNVRLDSENKKLSIVMCDPTNLAGRGSATVKSAGVTVFADSNIDFDKVIEIQY